MPQSTTASGRRNRKGQKESKIAPKKALARFTVALTPTLVREVEHYAYTADTSMSKAIALIVRLGLEWQGGRKREFFKELKANLDNDDLDQQDRLVDEFRALILGR